MQSVICGDGFVFLIVWMQVVARSESKKEYREKPSQALPFVCR